MTIDNITKDDDAIVGRWLNPTSVCDTNFYLSMFEGKCLCLIGGQLKVMDELDIINSKICLSTETVE